MKCGHCKSTDVTVDHVRNCAKFTGAPTHAPAAPANGATEKQIKFLTTLLADRDHGFDEATQTMQLSITTQSRKDTSKLIDHLLTCPRKQAKAATLEDGIYRNDAGELLRVYHTVHGANRQVASRINLDAPKESKKTDKFTYIGTKGLIGLTPAHMLPFEEACEIGRAYEWCCACGTILHNDKSVELGIGPVCRGKFA